MSGSSLGCGNPLAFSEVQQGQVVLDLGSGLGMDVILAAQRVGQEGKVIGLDMTPEMIDRAKGNAERAGVGEITDFRLGEMEDMPVADESVDWIISNCVVNLSPDKERVFQEAYRVLKPGGQMLVSDLVSTGLPEELKRDLSSWSQCLGGTVEEAQYLQLVKDSGFEQVEVVDRTDATPSLLGAECCGGSRDEEGCLRVDSIRVRAVKPSHR
jgi:arsenite methyltransferase